MQSDLKSMSWNANQPFYEHMKHQVWDVLSEYDRKLNESEGFEKLNALENLSVTVKHWFDMIRFYLDPTEIQEVEKLFTQIEDISDGAEFSSANLTFQQNGQIKQIINSIRTKLWVLTAKNGMLPSKRDMSGGEVWV